MKPTFNIPGNGNSSTKNSISHEGPIVLIGKNGSGKSRLGIWIEQNAPNIFKIKRISAQKALQIPPNILIQNSENAEIELLYGVTGQPENYLTKLRYLYQNKPHNFVLNDFQRVLSLLFSKKATRDSNAIKEFKRTGAMSSISKDEIDFIEDIWKLIYPQREIMLVDSKVQAKHPAFATSYDGTDMSDGERVALYLMAQILCIPEKSIIIIDEPEVHLNRTIISTLWDKLEDYRPDCLFIYITHELEFAQSRRNSKSYFISSFDGTNWNYTEISGIERLPREILMDLIGPRNKILFVEGEKQSLDYQLYNQYYSGFKVIPVKSCENVIKYTQSINQNSTLHAFEAFGIIDRDHRSEDEIAKLQSHKIYTLNLAESENLMVTEQIMEAVGNYLKFGDIKQIIQDVKDEIINRLSVEINNEKQPTDFASQQIKYELGSFEIDHRNLSKLNDHFNTLIGSIKINEIFDHHRSKLENIVSSKNYGEALKYYNRKSLVTIVANKLGMTSEAYRNHILYSIQEECENCQKDNILNALENYLPIIS
ncbi:MAG: AAA family ATPase [Saprospiraceae bacterium]|nr:AAA family ATPase [Saprospiraceae bacterium]